MSEALFEFMAETLSKDVTPVLYRKNAIAGGHTEHEFRWKRALNSNTDQIKVAYDLTPEQHAKCLLLFKRAVRDRGLTHEPLL